MLPHSNQKLPERHFSIDIETLGTSIDSVILSIGACSFTLDGYVADFFYEEISVNQEGRKIDPATVKWWSTQTIPCPDKGAFFLFNALDCLTRYLINPNYTPIIWCKGTDFDTAILADAYKSFGQNTPWKYNNVRDMRTLVKVMPWVIAPVNPTLHNALSDAQNQAEHIVRCLTQLDYLRTFYSGSTA